jgi:mgtE-like transporter
MAFYRIGKIIKDSLPVLLLVGIVGISSGQILNVSEDTLISNPILLILILPLIKIGGDMGSIFGARLSSSLHLGLIDSKVVRRDFIAVFIVGVTACLLLGMTIWIISIVMNINFSRSLLGLSMVVGILEVFIVLNLSMFVAIFSYKHGMDPDDTVIPITTTFADLIGIGFIFFALCIAL